jgi:hypothetical protein
MDRASAVQRVRQISGEPQKSWPGYTPHQRVTSTPSVRSVRSVRSISAEPAVPEPAVPEPAVPESRLIYFDQRLAADLLEHIGSTSAGRAMLAALAKRSNLKGVNFSGVLRQHDQRAILSQIIDEATDLKVEGVIDLHLPEGGSRQTSWEKLHPDQVIAIRGVVNSTKDVQPSSLRLKVGTTLVRAYVERDHFLHLNQSYLTGLPIITIVGKVRSLPRTEMCAAAIGVLQAQDRAQKSSMAHNLVSITVGLSLPRATVYSSFAAVS